MKMSKNIVFEGWLTKSPPSKRIWRTKWRRRWFALRQSGELPDQYYLDYYADRNCRRLKGTINLDLCEQVDAGLHMERGGNGALDTKLRGSVFTIQTQSRTYHLEADCEADMAKWVAAICRVCGLRATDDESSATYQNTSALSKIRDGPGVGMELTGPYIPISECITGVRAQGTQRAFTFDPKNIVTSANRRNQMYPGHVMRTPAELSGNESALSEDECRPFNASHSNRKGDAVAQSLTKLKVNPESDELDSEEGPPVPPRPPKSVIRNIMQKDVYKPPSIQPPPEIDPDIWILLPHRAQHGNFMNQHRVTFSEFSSVVDDEEECSHPSMQYTNLASLPPAVDRALKPRHGITTTTNMAQVDMDLVMLRALQRSQPPRADALQYLDLDLPGKSSPSKPADPADTQKLEDVRNRRLKNDEDCPYKTVDFLKTEAFNITMQDAELLRSIQN